LVANRFPMTGVGAIGVGSGIGAGEAIMIKELESMRRVEKYCMLNIEIPVSLFEF